MALFRRETQEEKRFGGFCVAFYLLILLLGVALGAVSWRERDSQSRNGPRLPEEPCFDYLSPSCSMLDYLCLFVLLLDFILLFGRKRLECCSYKSFLLCVAASAACWTD